MIAGVDRRAGRRADDGREEPPVARGRWVSEEASRSCRCRSRGARGLTGGGGRRKPINHRSKNQKENANQNDRQES